MKADQEQPGPHEGVLTYLSARTGLHFPMACRRDAAAGLSRVTKKFGIDDSEQFVDRLRSDERLFSAVIAEIAVGETYFFRDSAQLDAIRQVILPALVRGRPADAPLQVWSAGCSTGEEAYSLAIILEEEGLSDRASILATDISAAALNHARRAEYGRWSMRNDREGQLARYFSSNGNTLKVVDRLRRRVRFERLNLASDCYPSPATGTDRLDLILCRNVLIYFSKKHVKLVAKRLYASLADGGWLITGPSDPPLWHHAPFRTVIVPGAVLYRREANLCSRADAAGAARIPPTPTSTSRSVRHRHSAEASPVTSAPPSARRSAAPGRVRLQKGPEPAAPQDEAAWTERIRQLSTEADLSQAEQAAAEALSRHPLSIELHYLRSVLLVALDRHDGAVAALRRLLYLDRTLAAAHLALGTLLQLGGDLKAARRSFATAHRLCAARPAAEEVPLCEGETAGGLAEAARARIAQLRSLSQGG